MTMMMREHHDDNKDDTDTDSTLDRMDALVAHLVLSLSSSHTQVLGGHCHSIVHDARNQCVFYVIN